MASTPGDTFEYRSAHNNSFLTLRVIHELKRANLYSSKDRIQSDILHAWCIMIYTMAVLFIASMRCDWRTEHLLLHKKKPNCNIQI